MTARTDAMRRREAAVTTTTRVSRPGPGWLHVHVIRDAEADRWVRLTDAAAGDLRDQMVEHLGPPDAVRDALDTLREYLGGEQ